MPDEERAVAPVHEYSAQIRATPERIWRALTDETESAQWYYGTGVVSTWQEGSMYEYRFPDGTVAIAGQLLGVAAPREIQMTFNALWDDEVSADEPSRVSWSVAEEGDGSRVSVRHEDVAAGSATERQVTAGWPELLSSLKAFVEG